MTHFYRSSEELTSAWADPVRREEIIQNLEERGISYEVLAKEANFPDADLVDLLCHVAFSRPLLTRRQRAEKLRKGYTDFFNQYSEDARTVLYELIEKYADHGINELKLPDAFKLPPLSNFGTVPEISVLFGGADNLRHAVNSLQTLLYAS